MKHCKKCDTTKELTEFYITKGIVRSICKKCDNEYKKQHYIKNKDKYALAAKNHTQWFRDYKKQLKCNRCGYNKHPAALDFHHTDHKSKLDWVARMSKNKNNKEKIMEEISKCEVLCANCHRIEHSKHY